MRRETGKCITGAISAMLLCSVLGSTTIDSYSASEDVEWDEGEFSIPFAFDPETDSEVESSPVDVALSITDPDLNQNSASAETVTLTPVADGDDLAIRIEGEGGLDLVEASGISSCSGFGSALFTETGANTDIFEATFPVSNCGLDPEELANAELVAEYDGEHDSTIFRGYTGKLATSAKAIYTGLNVTITVTDHDQNKDPDVVENVKIKVEPDGLASGYETLDETGADTGVFEKKFQVGEDILIVDDGLIDDVLVLYVDAARSDGDMGEKELALSVETSKAKLTGSPSSGITPHKVILITLADKDINEDPDDEDVIDYNVLTVYTDNKEIADNEIRLGEDGFRMEETDENSGVFELELILVPAIKMDEIEFSASLGELEIPAEPGDKIVVSYKDESHGKTESLVMEVESFDPVIEADKEEYLPGDAMTVTIKDADANMDSGLVESSDVRVYSESDPVGNYFSAIETGEDTGVFTFQVDIAEGFGQDAVMAKLGDHATIEYEDVFPENHGGAQLFITSIPVGNAVPANESATAAEPATKNIDGSAIGNVTVSQHVMLSTEIENSLEGGMNFVAVVEVRNSEGITVYFAWQTGTLEPGGRVQVGLTWVPDTPGEYEVRTFVISSLDDPDVLSDVSQSGITVV